MMYSNLWLIIAKHQNVQMHEEKGREERLLEHLLDAIVYSFLIYFYKIRIVTVLDVPQLISY